MSIYDANSYIKQVFLLMPDFENGKFNIVFKHSSSMARLLITQIVDSTVYTILVGTVNEQIPPHLAKNTWFGRMKSDILA